MPETTLPQLLDCIRAAAHPLHHQQTDYDPLMELIGEARLVLIGEASHGTQDFYAERAAITQRLITEKGFTAVAVEADLPDAHRVNRYVRGMGDDPDAESALRGFQRFPVWMWRNVDVLHFVEWLRQHNEALPANEPKTGFYGLDLYSLYNSIEVVLDYLEKVDPEAAQQARYRYSCFEHFGEDSQSYGYAANFGIAPSCEQEAIAQVVELQRQAAAYAQHDGGMSEDEFFYAEQNARLVKNAEEYYRSMFRERASSWNLRDAHMVETVEHLIEHLSKSLGKSGRPPKVVIWAHNSHLGDARATEMGKTGEHNVGQLLRQKCDRDAVLIGFTTYTGTVMAASHWGGKAEVKQVRPGLPESYEALFHQVEIPRFLLPLRGQESVAEGLSQTRLERAIGVIYLPRSERVSHYFHANLAAQFDAVIHLDETHAVEALDRPSETASPDMPETFPSAL